MRREDNFLYHFLPTTFRSSRSMPQSDYKRLYQADGARVLLFERRCGFTLRTIAITIIRPRYRGQVVLARGLRHMNVGENDFRRAFVLMIDLCLHVLKLKRANM